MKTYLIICAITLAFGFCASDALSQTLRGNLPIHISDGTRSEVSYDGGLTYQPYRPTEALVDQRSVPVAFGNLHTGKSPALELFPNPTSDRISIRLSVAGSSVFSVEIVDQFSQVKYQSKSDAHQLRQGIVIPTHTFIDGVYRILVSNHANRWSKSFIRIGEGGRP